MGKKRRLLAHIEGQVARLERNQISVELARQRIQRAMSVLATLVARPEDVERLAELRRLVKRLEQDAAPSVRTHQRMLVRVECLLWQMALRDEKGFDPARAA